MQRILQTYATVVKNLTGKNPTTYPGDGGEGAFQGKATAQ